MLLTINNRVKGNNHIHQTSSATHETVIKRIDNIWETLKPLNIRNEDAVVEIAQWLSQSTFITKLNYTLIPAILYQDRAFSGQHNVVLSFALADKYEAHFVLLRSLFEFGKKPGASISSDRITRTFSIEIFSNQRIELLNYFETIFNWLSKEINFKVGLKEVIRFEERIRAERNQVYRNVGIAV